MLKRFILFLTAIAAFSAPVNAAPKFGKDGGVGSSTSTFSSGEPVNGTYAINGTTGEANFKTLANVVQVSPAFCPYSQLTGVVTSDNTTCVQNAINFACTAANGASNYAGGELVFARGAYYIKHVTIPSTCPGLRIRGQGYGSSTATTIVSDNNCTGPIFDFYSDATQNYVYGGGLSDVYLFNNTLSGGNFTGTTSCPSPIIRASYGRNMIFTRMMALSPNILIKIIAGLNNTVSNIAVDQALQNSTGVFEAMGMGALPDATGQLTRQDVTKFKDITVFGAPAVAGGGNQWYIGIWNHGLSQTLDISSVKFENASIALKIDCTNPGVSAPLLASNISACPGNSFSYDFETECAGSNCIQMRDTQSWHFHNTYVACFARTSTSNPSTSGCNTGLDIANSSFTSTGDISFIGGQINGAQASCVSNGGWQFTLTGVNLYGCNAANVGGSDVTILAPGANLGGSNSIVNNRMCTGPANNTISETGINVISGSNYNTVALNNWKGCGAGIIGTIGANSVLANNVGP